MSDTKPSTPEYRAISSLHNWENNPRTATKDGIERLIKQIKKLGVYKPLLITEDGTVLGGNMRLKALEQMGEKKVWVSVVQADTEEKKIEYALSDNDRVGKYEGDQLANLIGNFPEVEWGDYSVDIKEPELVSDLMDSFKEVEEDEAPAVEMGPAESKLGEVYQLGRHRVMCGDSTKIEDVERLMSGQKADMVFTDPPYGMEYRGRTFGTEGMDNDGKEFQQVLTDAVANIVTLFNNIVVAVCFAPTRIQEFIKATEPMKLQRRLTIYKPNRLAYPWRGWILTSEDIYLFEVGEVNYQTDVKHCHDVYTFDYSERPDKEINHPTVKPLSIVSDVISKTSGKDSTVADLFGGSGSTLIACEQLDRTCYMMELDPHYVDVIRKRYDNFVNNRKITGK